MELFLGKIDFDEENQTNKCSVVKIVHWKTYDGVLRIVSEEIEDDTREIDALSIAEQKVSRFPRLMGNFFPNLSAVTISGCGLKRIERKDLLGLKNLKKLMLSGNQIISLPGNLFEGTPKIETVSFYGNRIKFIGIEIFDSLKNLSYVNLKMNTNIDKCFKTHGKGVTMQELKAVIINNCQRESFFIIEKFFEAIQISINECGKCEEVAF